MKKCKKVKWKKVRSEKRSELTEANKKKQEVKSKKRNDRVKSEII